MLPGTKKLNTQEWDILENSGSKEAIVCLSLIEDGEERCSAVKERLMTAMT